MPLSWGRRERALFLCLGEAYVPFAPLAMFQCLLSQHRQAQGGQRRFGRLRSRTSLDIFSQIRTARGLEVNHQLQRTNSMDRQTWGINCLRTENTETQ